MKKKLQLRILSSLILAPLVLAAIYYGGIAMIVMVLVAFILSMIEFFGLARQGNQIIRDLLLGVMYLCVAMLAFIYLRLGFADGLYWTIALMLGVWGSDVGAYFTGKIVGGPKLLPKVSPNKTWAGLVGGMVTSGIILALFIQTFNEMSVFLAFSIGLALGLTGQIGDLYISNIKRRVGAKDTGDIIPGHGGLLDRIDSLLLAAPVFTLILMGLSHA